LRRSPPSGDTVHTDGRKNGGDVKSISQNLNTDQRQKTPGGDPRKIEE